MAASAEVASLFDLTLNMALHLFLVNRSSDIRETRNEIPDWFNNHHQLLV